jgi:hypothetical protein
MRKFIIKDHLMRTAALLSLLALIFVAGCSSVSVNSDQSTQLVTAQAPIPSGYLIGTQHKMQALAHWDLLADKVAKNCAASLDHFFPQHDVRVYVAPMGTTPFAKVYREALLTRLVDYGVPIAFEPEGAALLEVGLELVTHRRVLDKTSKGLRRALDPGFRQRKNSAGLYEPVPVVAEESGYFDAPTPDSEVQITSALVHQNAYLYRDSSIFYVNGSDWSHYRLQAPQGAVELKRFSLVN